MNETTDPIVQTVVLPLLEEVLHVDVRRVDRGGTVVRIDIAERDERVERDLLQDVLSVERVAVGRVVEAAPPVREEGDVTIIPIVEEQLVVTKRLVLTEEIHVRRQQKTTPWVETVTLRREVATVEPINKQGA